MFIYIYTRFGINGRNRNLDAEKASFVYDRESKSVIGDNIDGKIATASSDTTIAAGPKEGKPFETVNPFAGTNLFKMQKDRISNVVPTAPSPNFDSTNPHLRMSDAYRSKDGMSLKNPMTRPDMPQNSVSARVRLSALSPGKRAPGLGI